MSWENKYVVLRPDESTKELQVVYCGDEMKKANYWLRYIAKVGDALFTTPMHPKNQGKSELVFFAHKLQSGKVDHSQSQWDGQFGEHKKPDSQGEAPATE